MHSVLVVVQLIWNFPLFVPGEITLTTATPWINHLSVKPTTLFKRIAVDRHAGEHARVSSDIFDKMKTVYHRRRNQPDIWNWDYWCQLQIQTGNCTETLQRYYYDAQLDQCSTFSYSGCSGNKNNFETLVDCERHCKGAALMQMKPVERSISCSLQPNAGLCLALFDKYYYDVNDGICKMFVYGGCGGNENRFGSPHQCLAKCRNSGNNEDK